jgi:hypothetical protein
MVRIVQPYKILRIVTFVFEVVEENGTTVEVIFFWPVIECVKWKVNLVALYLQSWFPCGLGTE